MYFQLAKNSVLSMTASTTDVIFATVVYEQGMNPSRDYIEEENTTFATAYVDSIRVSSITLKNTSASTVTSICIYIDYDLFIPCFSLLAGQTLLLDETGQTFQQVSPTVNVSVTCGSGGGSDSLTNVNLVIGDFPLTAVPQSCYLLEDGVISSNQNINVSNLNTEGDEMLFLNRDPDYKLIFTGQPVLYADERVATEISPLSNVLLRYVGGKLRVMWG